MGITTSTAYGRAEILWPDFAHEGGSALHAKIVASVGELSDNMTGKWSGEQTLPNGASYTFEHNFGLALGELTVAIYVAGAFVQEGSSAQWTLAEVDSENITITNNTGGELTFFAYCLGFNIKKVIGNASATNTGLMTSGNQTIGGNKKFLNGIATTNIYEDGLDTGVNIDGINVKDGSISNLQSQQLEQQNATPATPASGKSKFYVKDDGVAYILNSDGIETPVGSGSTIERVSHTAHGFIVGNVLYDAGTNFAKGNCTDAEKAEVIAMVSRVIDVDTFEVITNGIPSAGLTVDCFKEGVLPSDGDVCFVSDVDGKLTYTEPNVVGQISKPCFFVRSVDATYAFGYFANMRGVTVGGTNVSTVIPLTLADTTVIQNVSAWPDGGGGKINGTITVLGPATPQGCRVEISFQKRSSTSYEISPAFPASSIVAASGTLSASVNETNGNISITLPTITGATSASVTFSIDSAALGAQLPLQIDSNLISWREPTMFRNRVINGNFDIWQRGTSLSQNTGSSFLADRWLHRVGNGQGTLSRQANDLSSFKAAYFFRFAQTTLSTDSVLYLLQRIEDVISLSGENTTLSFWAKANTSKTISVNLNQNFGSGGSSTVSNIGTTNINLTTVWEKFTITFSIPSVAGKTIGANNYLELYFNLASFVNTTFTFDIAQVQLEPGSIATPFEFRPYGTELALCQRYYESGEFMYLLTNSAGSTYAGYLINYKVNKRAASPTFTVKDYAGNSGRFSVFHVATWNLTNNVGVCGDRGASSGYGDRVRMIECNTITNPSMNNVAGLWTADAEL